MASLQIKFAQVVGSHADFAEGPERETLMAWLVCGVFSTLVPLHIRDFAHNFGFWASTASLALTKSESTSCNTCLTLPLELRMSAEKSDLDLFLNFFITSHECWYIGKYRQ